MDEKKKEIDFSNDANKDGKNAENEAVKPEIIIESKEEKKKEPTKEEKEKRFFVTYAFVLVFVIIISLFCFFYFKNKYTSSKYNQCNQDNTSSDQPSSSKPAASEISITDSKVTQFSSLFKYENNDISKVFPSIISKEKTVSSTLVLDHQLSIATNDYLKSNMIVDSYATCDDLADFSFNFTCSDENFALIDNNKMLIYRFTADKLASSYNKIFGNQANLIHKSFETANGTECFYNTNYICLKKDQKPAGIESVSYIISAYEYPDRMEINTKYVWLEGSTGYANIYHDATYFNNYFSNPATTDELNIKQNYESLVPTIKYTFMKNQMGNYYWDSSVIVEE